LAIPKAKIDLNPDDVDVKLSGGLVTKIASVFIPIVKNKILPGMISKIETTITQVVTTKIDPWLAANGTQQEIPYLAGVTLDFAQMGSGVTVSSDGYIYDNINGTFFDSHKVAASSFYPTAFNVRDPAGKDF